jgi:hypothetical protein
VAQNKKSMFEFFCRVLYVRGVKGQSEHLAMASSTKFSETFFLQSLNQQNNQTREKGLLLLLCYQPIIFPIKINQKWFLEEERISF